MKNLKSEAKQNLKTNWNFEPIFSGDSDPKILERRKLDEKKTKDFIAKWQPRDDYLNDPRIMEEALNHYELWARETGCFNHEVYYFHLRTQQDQIDPVLKAAYNQVVEKSTKLQNQMQFFTLKVAKIPLEKQQRFLSYQGLQKYKHFLENLFKGAKYQLSDSEEKIINLKRQAAHDNWTKMVSAFISQEEREVLMEDGTKSLKSFSNLGSNLLSQNKKVRDSAAEAMNEVLSKYVSVAEHEINSIMANKKVDDELRHYPRPDSESHLADDIETEVVDTLIKTVSEKFSVAQKWYALKAKLMGVKELKYHERMVELGEIGKEYPYDDACRLVSKVLTKLDPDFGQIFETFVETGKVDVFPKKGKYCGAFCAAGSITLPTYILLNHTDKFNDVCTLAHEVGHGINDELMKRNQDALNFGSPLSTAEVASTFMEDFIISETIEEADDNLKLSIMCKKLDDDVATIFRQAACYLFEQELHREFREKGYLSKDEIGRIFQKNMNGYMGEAVEQSKGSENWWVHWPHIRSFFYVYSYVSGQLISKSLQSSVRKDPKFIAKVKQFLSAGTSATPKEIFEELGIDITQESFWNAGLREIEVLLSETERLARTLGKL